MFVHPFQFSSKIHKNLKSFVTLNLNSDTVVSIQVCVLFGFTFVFLSFLVILSSVRKNSFQLAVCAV